jgi:hypothetical protein
MAASTSARVVSRKKPGSWAHLYFLSSDFGLLGKVRDYDVFEQDGVGVAVRGCQMSACRLGRDWHGLGEGAPFRGQW